MIKITDLSVQYGEHVVFDRYCCEFPLTGNTVIRGSSGSGKTTLLRILTGLQKPDSGHVFGLQGLRSTIVFQEDRLLPWYSALKNVSLVSNQERAKLILTSLGLEGFMYEKPSALSGGMKRRVAIARALAFGGDLFLLDEPFSGLDENAKQQTACVLKALEIPLLVVVHSEAEIKLINPQTVLNIK